MDGSGAIERNRVALVRIVASLIAMAGLALDPGAAAEPRRTLPRHLWRAILRLLRPAEAAARRLIIAAARGLVVPPPSPRKPKPRPNPKPQPVDPEALMRRLGLAVLVSRNLTPPASPGTGPGEAPSPSRGGRGASFSALLPLDGGGGPKGRRGNGT